MKRRLELAALGGLVLLAFVLRVVGTSFCLDLENPKCANVGAHIDERGMVEAVQDNFLHGSLDPASFVNRGPAAFLLFGVVDASLIGIRALTHPRGWQGRMQELEANPSWLHLVHRCVSAAVGAAAVFVLARMVGREFDARSGLLAGLFLAVAYLHVRESHFGTVDALFSLTLLFALDRMFLWIRAPSAGRAVASGLALGVTIASKYFGVLLGANLLLAPVLARKNAPASKLRVLAWAVLAVPVGFLLVSPGVYAAREQFLRMFDWTAENYTNSGTAASLFGNARFYATYGLWFGLGEPVLLFALWGLVVAWRHGTRGRFYLVAVLCFLPSMLATSAKPVRYGLPELTLLAGCAGLGAAALLARTGPRLGAGLVLLSVAPSLLRSISFDVLLLQQDTRVEMLAELQRRKVPAEDVLAIGWHNGLPIPPKRARASRPYVTYGPKIAGRPEVALAEVRAKPPRLVLWDLTAPEAVVPERAALEEFLREQYREVLRLDGRRGATELPYPISPALMLPYESPWEMSRPGSALVLYERIGSE